MKKFFSLLLFFSQAFGSTAGQESQHFLGEFWQRADGKYCIQIWELDQNKIWIGHWFVFDSIYHSTDCPCGLNNALKPKNEIKLK